jgi:hypothetical protein
MDDVAFIFVSGVFVGACLFAALVGAILFERWLKGPRRQPRVFDRPLKLVRKD